MDNPCMDTIFSQRPWLLRSSDQERVGTVCIGFAGPSVLEAKIYRFAFADRRMNKIIFAVTALDMLRNHLVSYAKTVPQE